MNTFDDSDMKIFGVKEEPDSTDGAEVQALAEEMKRQRLNGNSERAKQLGIRMAALAPDSADADSLDLSRLLGDPPPCPRYYVPNPHSSDLYRRILFAPVYPHAFACHHCGQCAVR